MEEPLAYPFAFLTKRYFNGLAKLLPELTIDRYHYVLVLIDDHQESLSQKALAEILQIDKSYMVSVLHYLEDQGCVIRKKNPKDRREQLLKLTDKARADLISIREAIKLLNEKAFTNICESDKNTFAEVLNMIQINLSDITIVKPYPILKNFN